MNKHDAAGNTIERTYLGLDEQPTRDKGGSLGWTAVYSNGKITERTYFGYNGAGVTKQHASYDDRGFATKYVYLDDNNVVVTDTAMASPAGCARTTTKATRRGGNISTPPKSHAAE